jgi:putative membrane protein
MYASHYYWNDWYAGWGYVLWFGFIFLLFSSVGNWGFAYRTHRKYSGLSSQKNAIDILNERYVRGEVTHEEFARMKSAITDTNFSLIGRST